MARELKPHQQRINTFVDHHQLAWDLGMAGLALVFVALMFVEDRVGTAVYERYFATPEVGITLLFVAEFTVRCYAAESRLGYLRRHWIDLIALLPAVRALRFLRAFRVFRMLEVLQALRILRLGALVRLLAEVERAGRRVTWIAKHNGVHVFLTVAAGLVLVGGGLVYELEHAANPEFHDLSNSLWWAFATMATVGYGDGPETVVGRVVAGLIMVVGIGCFGLITATVTTVFIERTHGPQTSANELKSLLLDLRARLDHLERELEQARAQNAATSAERTEREASAVPVAATTLPVVETER
jgi:voltage-gated potassium channel